MKVAPLWSAIAILKGRPKEAKFKGFYQTGEIGMEIDGRAYYAKLEPDEEREPDTVSKLIADLAEYQKRLPERRQ